MEELTFKLQQAGVPNETSDMPNGIPNIPIEIAVYHQGSDKPSYYIYRLPRDWQFHAFRVNGSKKDGDNKTTAPLGSNIGVIVRDCLSQGEITIPYDMESIFPC
ncbi:hypothetical protein HYX09_04625 [Candidatus Woesearchaeota archaeon]|nr:hypothetical protein [Candidatus Woesearchaeota archaeon]